MLTLADVAVRPEPTTWSPLEYACHVRDVHRIFDQRVGLMLDEDDPRFPNWDQDETAIEERYAEQDPAVVSVELLDAATAVADRYESVPPGAWGRRGCRSNGSEFTVESIGRYHLHDIVHHPRTSARPSAGRRSRPTTPRRRPTATADRPPTTPILERPATPSSTRSAPAAGCSRSAAGPGATRASSRQAGLDVRRTDITPGFVELLRADGHDADVLDPLTDDLDDPARPGTPYDGVWASACLLHVARADLPAVLRPARRRRPASGGVLGLAVKEGDGEGWSTHGHVSRRRGTSSTGASRAAARGARGRPAGQVEQVDVRLGSETGPAVARRSRARRR